jgi:hypothetical protein
MDDDRQRGQIPPEGWGDPALGLLCRDGGSGRLPYLSACHVMRRVRRSRFSDATMTAG